MTDIRVGGRRDPQSSGVPGDREQLGLRAGALLRVGAPPLSAGAERKGWARLRAAVERRQGDTHSRVKRRVIGGGVVAVTAALVMAALTGWGTFHRRPPTMGGPLTYVVDGIAVPAATALPYPLPHGARLTFSDGTNVVVQPAGRATVMSLQVQGARVALADGELAVNVVHRPAAHWRFDAGPFSVFVDGTSFALRWTAAEQRLSLRMYSGAVTVTGPLGNQAIKVRGGQVLTAHLPEHRISLEADGAGTVSRGPLTSPVPTDSTAPAAPLVLLDPPPPAVPPLLAPPVSRRHIVAGVPSSSGTASTATSGANWRQLVAAGRSSDVLADAQERGLRVTLSLGRQDDLAALADAARYSRQNGLARRTLHSLRDRFPASDTARDAAFFLGRLEEADHPGSARSLEWYRRYRTEAPAGLYLADALGREMMIMQRLYGDEAARPTARQYLKLFPAGHLAPQARQLASTGAIR